MKKTIKYHDLSRFWSAIPVDWFGLVSIIQIVWFGLVSIIQIVWFGLVWLASSRLCGLVWSASFVTGYICEVSMSSIQNIKIVVVGDGAVGKF